MFNSARSRDSKEEQAATLVRNALIVAGLEMGKTGDHWPVINATIHSIAKDLEDLKTERNVDEVMKQHLYEQLAIMEAELPKCTAEGQAELGPKLKELREIYDAYFSEATVEFSNDEDAEMPAHIARANTILNTLEDDNE